METNPSTNQTTVRQIGRMNILAISGGRIVERDDTTIQLPVRYGYVVEVQYQPGLDLYTVRRLFRRAGKETVKAQVSCIYATELGDEAYRASCYHEPYEQ